MIHSKYIVVDISRSVPIIKLYNDIPKDDIVVDLFKDPVIVVTAFNINISARIRMLMKNRAHSVAKCKVDIVFSNYIMYDYRN